MLLQTFFSFFNSPSVSPDKAGRAARRRLAANLSGALKRTGRRTIVCWGTGQMAADVAAAVPGRIGYFVDNDERRHGTTFHDRPVRPPAVLAQEDLSDLVVLVASMYDAEIRKRLTEIVAGRTHAVICVAPLHTAAAPVVESPPPRRPRRPRSRTILIVGGYGYSNVGDEAQLDATLADLRVRFPDRLLKVLTPDPARTHLTHGRCLVGEAPRLAFYDQDRSALYKLPTPRHKLAFLARSWWLLTHAWLIKTGAPLALVGARRMALLNEIANAELIFFSGGGYLTGSTLSRLWDGAFLMRIARVLDTPVVLSGQTIGLWDSRFSKWLARDALDGAAIIATRDGDASPAALEDLALDGPRVMVTCDDALFDQGAASPDTVRAAFGASGIDPDLAARPYLVLNAHYWGVTTSKERQQLVSRLLSILDRLRDIGAPPVVGVPMVADDSDVLLELERLRPEGWYRMLRTGERFDLPRGVIRGSQLCLSMKHHPLIFAMGERVPAISLTRGSYYHHKNLGALALVGLDDCGVSLADDDYLTTFEAVYRRLTSDRRRISEQIAVALRPLAARRTAFFDAVEEVVRGGPRAGASPVRVPCPVCEIGIGTEALPYIARERAEDDLFRRLRLCACSSCDTYFAEPRPSAAALASYYAQAYRSDGRNTSAGQGFPGDHPWYLSRAVTVARLVSDALSTAPPSSRLRALEIGAGYGHNLFALKRALNRPLNITAIEPDRACHPTLQQVVDRIVTGDLDSLADANGDGGPFDIILLLHVLEHVADPAAFLGRIHALLRPGGLLAIEVPHCPELRVRWYNPTTPHVPHLFFFTANGLHSLLRRCNFVIESLASYGPEFDEQGSYDRSFTESPLPVDDAIARGECPPPPFPLFGEAGPNRLFLRALVRVPGATA